MTNELGLAGLVELHWKVEFRDGQTSEGHYRVSVANVLNKNANAQFLCCCVCVRVCMCVRVCV